MQSGKPKLIEANRILLLGALMLAGLAGLALALYREQVLRHSEYDVRHRRQSIRRVLQPAVRGRIFDRRGQVLAENRPSYCLAVYIEELRRPGPWRNTAEAVDRMLDRLAADLSLPREDSIEDIERHIRLRLPLPYLAWRDIDEIALNRLAEYPGELPGIDIYVLPERYYPLGKTAAHVIGYVGRDRPEPVPGEPFDFYMPEMRGRIGIEQRYDRRLSGIPGGRLIRVDARGYKHHAWEGREAIPGADVTLTVDLELQQVAESTIEGLRAAVAVLDVRNGDILALASSPSYDISRMSPAPAPDYWRELLADPGRPLLNRAISGTYPPGSTFKPVVALAALGHQGFDPYSSLYECAGSIKLGGNIMRCWRRSGHGPIALRQSLAQSCNVYYFLLAMEMGYDRIYQQAESLGFGFSTGVDLNGEASGLLPGPAWKRRRLNEGWWTGDTCNVSIGQGALLATPIQMAAFTVALANGGSLYRPRLVRQPAATDGEIMLSISWPEPGLQVVRDGMRDSVNTSAGTGNRARIEQWVVAGKTGTAQYGTRGGVHAWMIAYAPFEQPRYAVAVLVESADAGGGQVAGPIVKQLMRTLVQLDSSPGWLINGGES